MVSGKAKKTKAQSRAARAPVGVEATPQAATRRPKLRGRALGKLQAARERTLQPITLQSRAMKGLDALLITGRNM